MELREYIDVVSRRWLLVVAIVVLTGLVSFGLALTQRPNYTAVTRVSVRQRTPASIPPTPGPTGQPGYYTYDKYYNFYSSEFLADDYAIIVTSQAFTDLVDAKLAQDGHPEVHAGGTLVADRKQRELTISATTDDSARSQAITKAVGEVFADLSAPGANTPSKNGVAIQDDALFAVIDPLSGVISSKSRQYTNAAIATGVGLALALALAFLLEALGIGRRAAAGSG